MGFPFFAEEQIFDVFCRLTALHIDQLRSQANVFAVLRDVDCLAGPLL